VPLRRRFGVEAVVEDQLVEEIFGPEALVEREVPGGDPAVAGEELR
jgi:hypothetical protein